MGNVAQIMARPRPPDEMLSLSKGVGPRFMADPGLLDWIKAAYLDPDGALYTPEHAHLEQATLGCLWTTVENTRQGRRIVGQAEMPGRANRGGKWQNARAEQQLEMWFGEIPDFLLTFDVFHADGVDDASFCSLVDHELYHCAQATDDMGQPRFNQQTGAAVWTIRGHDLEEFVGVVRRFGIEAAGEAATDFVIAAAKRPELGPARVAQACGTCLRRAA